MADKKVIAVNDIPATKLELPEVDNQPNMDDFDESDNVHNYGSLLIDGENMQGFTEIDDDFDHIGDFGIKMNILEDWMADIYQMRMEMLADEFFGETMDLSKINQDDLEIFSAHLLKTYNMVLDPNFAEFLDEIKAECSDDIAQANKVKINGLLN